MIVNEKDFIINSVFHNEYINSEEEYYCYDLFRGRGALGNTSFRYSKVLDKIPESEEGKLRLINSKSGIYYEDEDCFVTFNEVVKADYPEFYNKYKLLFEE